MKKYEYVSLCLKNNVVKDAVLDGQHIKAIDEYAAKGCRYVGFIPTLIGPSGKIINMDLIFETEV